MHEHNNEHAENILPQLMANFDVSAEELVDFMYNLRTVKTHGFGHVQIHVFDGRVQRVEALIRTLKQVEASEKRD